MVFSNPDVVRRINQDFIPVALKAGLVNHPPPGVEGSLYAEIGRSKPAPQGICTVNSAGKVLAWALSFDDDASIVQFLDHVTERYQQFPEAQRPVIAQRYMKFPSHHLADVDDSEQRFTAPERHGRDDRCPARPALAKGTLVGRMIGRPLDKDGKPIDETVRQEDYMESRIEIPLEPQVQLTAAVEQAEGKRFRAPAEFGRALIRHAFLGQLDVNPMGETPGGRNHRRFWRFYGQAVPSGDPQIVRLRMDGESLVEGGQDGPANLRDDGRLWEHHVQLKWQGYVDIKNGRLFLLAMIAQGDERLKWGNARFNLTAESAVEHLMAGHPIDLECSVRYGVFAEPAAADEVIDRGTR